MALTRLDLTPLDGFDNRIDWNAAFVRWNNRIVKAIAGGEVLAAHAAVFGSSFLGIFVWKLVSNPTDLSGIRGFQYWGILVALHAVLIGGFTLIARLLGMNQPTFVSDAPAVYRVSPQQAETRQTAPATLWARGVESAARVNDTARRWASPVRSTPSEEALWPASPALLQSSELDDVGEVTWPETAPLSTTLNATANPLDELVSIDHGVQTETVTQTWLDGFVESRSRDKEHRWSWVEAAAGSWISKRDASTPTPQAEDVILPDQQTDEESHTS